MTQDHHVGRRGFLTSAAVAGGAAALTGAGPASAAPAHGGGGGKHSQLSRADRAFLEHGLIHAAWVRSGSEDGWFPDQQLWKDAGFTTPQFYGEDIAESARGYVEYSQEVMRGAHKDTWALARVPEKSALRERPLPDPEADWMTDAMASHTKNLFSICFGDEEAHSDELVEYLAGAYAKVHRDHPDVLVHNNQALGQYAGGDLADYVRAAQPDLLTWDWYGWQKEQQWDAGSPTPLYRQLGRYRKVALAGTDGAGTDPLAFGQYTIGFRLQPEWDDEDDRYKRRVYVSESQQNLFPYVTWAAGGKWLSLFRWELDEEYPPWETDGLFLTDADETPLPAYERYARINADMAAFSPYLTRLRSRAFARVGGRSEAGDPIPAPTADIEEFTAQTDPGSGVLGLAAVNLGVTNGGHPGDVFLGTFRPIPGMTPSEHRDVLPDAANTPAFMLVNGLTAYNSEDTDPFGTGGGGHDTRQAVTVTVSAPGGQHLFRVSREHPRPQQVPLSYGSATAEFTVELDGGQGALYFWG